MDTAGRRMAAHGGRQFAQIMGQTPERPLATYVGEARKQTRRKPRSSLSCPKTGSAVSLRRL
jgi:hypothetical protein